MTTIPQQCVKIKVKFIIKFLFLILGLLSGIDVKAQNISINGTGATAHPSAILDVSSPTLGLLIPRLPLVAINNPAPVTSPTISLLVFNTATASTGTNAVSPGYYYWDGAKWVRFAYSASGSSANDWNTLGNAGTNSSTNFVGTTDNQDLVFKRNGVQSGLLNNILNSTSFGIGALNTLNTGANNIAIGNSALNANTSGDRNVAIGVSALATNTVGAANVAIGHSAMLNNISGNNNVGVGTNAGISNTSGNQNVWVGASSGFSNTTGSNNVSIGNAAGRANTIGISNVFIGAGTGSDNTTGSGNTFLGSTAGSTNTIGANNTYVGTFSGRYSTQNNNSSLGNSSLYNNTLGADLVSIGYQSLYNNTTGTGVVGLGKLAGFSNTTGNNNTFLGTNANATAGTYTNATAIGYNAIVGSSDALILGGTGTVAVNVGIGTTTPTERLHLLGYERVQSILGNNINTMIGTFQAASLYKNLGNATLFGSNSNFGGFIEGGENGQLVLATQDNQASDGVYFVNGGGDFMSDNTYDNVTMVVRADGRVGIGTTSPGRQLHSKSTTNSNAVFDYSNTATSISNGYGLLIQNNDQTPNNYANLMFSGDPSGTGNAWAGISAHITDHTIGNEDADLAFWTKLNGASSEKMVIMNSGNVGIGTTAPTEKLEVQGSVKIVDGTQGAGKVFTSDATGKGSWQVSSGSLLSTQSLPVQSIPPTATTLLSGFSFAAPSVSDYRVEFRCWNTFVGASSPADVAQHVRLLKNGIPVDEYEHYTVLGSTKNTTFSIILHASNCAIGDVLTIDFRPGIAAGATSISFNASNPWTTSKVLVFPE